MTKTATSPYDVADHLRTREDMAAYLEASLEAAPAMGGVSPPPPGPRSGYGLSSRHDLPIRGGTKNSRHPQCR